MIKTDKNIRELIEETVEKPNLHFSGEHTYSTLFLIPMFDIQLEGLFFDYFINAYIDDKELIHEYKRPLFVLTKTPSLYLPDFRIYDTKLRKNRNFVYTYSVGTEKGLYLQMYVFECPQEFEKDYDNFINGTYSKFSDYFKRRFPKTIQEPTGQFIESPLYGAINRTYSFKKKVETLIDYKLPPESEYFAKPY